MKWLRDNYKTILLVSGEIVAFAWTAISLVLDLTDLTNKKPGGEFLTLLSLIIFVVLVCIHIFSLRRQLSPRIDMVFGDFPACRHSFQVEGGLCTLFRVGLINYGGKTIENIQVSLEQINPQGITFGPVRLQFMHQRQANEEFRLHPSKKPSLFVDVIQDVPISDPPGRMFNIPYAISGVPNMLQRRTYSLALVAEGNDVPTARKNFLISLNGEELDFREEGSLIDSSNPVRTVPMARYKKVLLGILFVTIACGFFIVGGFVGFDNGYSYRVFQASVGDSYSTLRTIQMINSGDIKGAKKHLEMELDTEILEHWSGLSNKPFIFNMLVENEVATKQLMAKVVAYRKTGPPITEDTKVKAAIDSVVIKYNK